MDQQELRRLAQLGAAARLADLERERATLLRLFPGLRAVSQGREGALPPGNPLIPGAVARRRRRGMSPAARKAVSIRMKRYWAQRRKAKAKTA
jgi:hypothetical protein